MYSYPEEEAIIWDHKLGFWPNKKYTLAGKQPRLYIRPAEKDSCYPRDILPRGATDFELSKGFVGTSSSTRLLSGIKSEKFTIQKMPLSYLVCGRFSGLTTEEILKTYKTCDDRNCCNLIAKKVTKTIINALSTKIFSNKTQAHTELIANAVDSTGESGTVGKFGIGFFSALGMITSAHPLVIISGTRDTLLHIKLYDLEGEYYFDMTSYNYEGESGTFMILGGIRDSFSYDLKPKIQVVYRKNYTRDYSLICDRGSGISEAVAFEKLLLPSLSTKRAVQYTKNMVEKSKHLVFRIMVNNYVIYTGHTCSYQLNFSNKYDVPLSRDDLTLKETDESEIIAFLTECDNEILVNAGKRSLYNFLSNIEWFSEKTHSPITRKILRNYLASENARHPIKTTLFFDPPEPFYYGKTLYIKATQEALKKHYPGNMIGTVYAIKEPGIPMPTNKGFPGLLFYDKPESLIPFEMQLKQIDHKFDPRLTPLYNVLSYCLIEKYGAYKYLADMSAFFDYLATLAIRDDCEEIVEALCSCYMNYEMDYRRTLNSCWLVYIPPYFTTQEFIEAVSFMHIKSSYPIFYIPYTTKEMPKVKMSLEDYLRFTIQDPDQMEGALRRKIYFDANGLRRYPHFRYNLYNALEKHDGFTELIFERSTIDSPGDEVFSMKDQISATFTQKKSIDSIESLQAFIKRVGLRHKDSNVKPKVDYTRSDIDLIRLAVNYGTPRPYFESILYELCQNSRDAGSPKIECNVYELGDHLFELRFRDYAGGLPISSYLSLSIPFYSEKGSESIGKIGSGFFNIYKNAERVIIRSQNQTKAFKIIDTPVRVEGEVVDVDRYFSPTKMINRGTGTSVQIYIKGDNNVRHYCGQMATLYKRAYNDIGEMMYHSSNCKFYENKSGQMFITINKIPYAPSNFDYISVYVENVTVDIPMDVAGTNQSRTIATPLKLSQTDLAVLECLNTFTSYGSSKITEGMLYADLPKTGYPWSLFPPTVSSMEDISESLESLKTAIPGITEYGIRYIKSNTIKLLEDRKIVIKSVIQLNQKVKAVKISEDSIKLLKAIGEAWNELSIRLGVYKRPVKQFEVKKMAVFGLYDRTTHTISLDPETIRNAGQLIDNIKAKTYKEIIHDPDWKYLLSVDSYPSKTFFHEMEHHRDDSSHTDSSHGYRKNVKVSADLYLDGQYTFDAISNEIAKYLFCNGLYDLIRKRL